MPVAISCWQLANGRGKWRPAVLAALRIKNLALVTELSLEPGRGFTAVTGETGAGKSVVLGALNLLLGRRADRSAIRTGADACSVEASFHIPARAPAADRLIEEAGCEPCEEGWLHLRRVFTAAGSNRQFVNNSPAPLSLLASLGDLLVDLHGPHDHQSLLAAARQLELLDAYAGASDRAAAFADLMAKRRALAADLEAASAGGAELERQADFLAHQVHEIEDARLNPDEEPDLEAAFQRTSNAARLLELGQAALAGLSGDEGAAAAQIGSVGRLLREFARLDPSAQPLVDAHSAVAESLRELATDLERRLDHVELDPASLAALEARLSLIHGLKRKYGGTLADVIAFAADARAKLDHWNRRDDRIAELKAAVADADAQIRAAGDTLSAARRAAAPGLGRAVAAELERLGFKKGAFSLRLQQNDAPSVTGFDSCEFEFSPNPGEPARPLRAIASSGELARVMLGLKTALAAQDDIPVLVFDEVDANIGGETAAVVGKMLRDLGRRRQVIAITHLAPVAATADAQWKVVKSVVNDRAETFVAKLSDAERVEELARMLGGATEASRRHARELMGAAGA
jgi:DNA repair protein RecN (Recombination protein N)